MYDYMFNLCTASEGLISKCSIVRVCILCTTSEGSVSKCSIVRECVLCTGSEGWSVCEESMVDVFHP